MKLRVTVTGEYEVTDDAAELERIYGTADPDECAKVDQENAPMELLEMADRIVSHRVQPVGPYTTEGDPAELDDDDLAMAMGIHDVDCPCAYCAEWKKRRAVKFAHWIISLDDPAGPGFEARKSVSMGQIIGKAREALAIPEE